MNAETGYLLLNLFILPGWLLLAVAPRWRWTESLVMSGGYSAVYALIYVVLIVWSLGKVDLDFSSLEAVKELFSSDTVLLAGWVHYLAFDLLVAGWLLKNSQGRGVPHGWMLPVLLLTLYLGPAGYLLYRVGQGVRRQIRPG